MFKKLKSKMAHKPTATAATAATGECTFIRERERERDGRVSREDILSFFFAFYFNSHHIFMHLKYISYNTELSLDDSAKSGVNDEPKMYLSVGMRRNSSTAENNNAAAQAAATTPEGRGLPRRESTKRISLVSSTLRVYCSIS